MDLFSTTPGQARVLRRHVQRASADVGGRARDDRQAAARAGARARLPARRARAAGAARSSTRGSACRSSSPASARCSSPTSSTAPVESYDDLLANDVELFTGYRRELMKHGIFELPLNLKRSHFSYAHTDDDVDRLLEATEAAVTAVLAAAGDRPGGRLHDRPRRRPASRSGGCSTRRSRTPAAGRTASSRSRRSRTATGRPCSSRAATTATSTRARSPRCGSSRSSTRRACSGRIIVIPVISKAASKANTRMWPSGANFNRSFPGRPDGPPNEQLADYFTRVLFPLADVVIDMHSGGRTAWFLPCSHMHVVDDPAQRKAMLEAMQAWNSEFHFLYVDVNGTGLLPVEAENQGKLVVTTELGGGGRVPAPVHELAWSGLTNVLRHVGVLEGEVVRQDPACADPRRARPAQLRDRRGGRHLRRAARAGRGRAARATPSDGCGSPTSSTASRPCCARRSTACSRSSARSRRPRPATRVFVLGQPIEASALL